MTIGFVKAAALCVLAATSTAGVNAQRAPAGAACDKTCLLAVADAYLAALVAHDAAKAPMAPNAKFTEQAQPVAVGDGQLWKLTTEGPTTFKIPVPDPIVGQIGLIVMLEANLPAPPPRGGGAGAGPAAPAQTGPVAVQLALRLEVVNRQITEAEHVFARIDALAQVAALQTPRPAFLATVAPADRMPRSMMFLVANAYYDSPVLDKDGSISDRTVNFAPFDLEAAHIYKIFGGKLHEIEAMGFSLPLNSKNGWSPFPK